MNESLLNRILKEHKRRTRSLALILCLSMIVSLGTFAGFHQTAIAKVYTREVLDCPYAREGAEPVAHVHNDDCYDGGTLVCTLPEREAHTHDDSCYAESRLLTCGLEENPGHQHSEECFDENGELICQIPEGEGAHAHTDDCYTIERALVCNQAELPVHVHDADCFRTEEISVDEPEEAIEPEQPVNTVPEMPVSDPNADLETSDDWNREFENLELSGNWARDLVLVAATQQGRGESPNNFEAVLNDAGDAWVRHGYTRYGAWYGYPYAEWDAMFVSFCLRYAGIPAENVPNNPTAALMAESFSMGGLFAGRDYVPAVGDLIFFDTLDDEITNIDHMGIVYHVDTENGTINTVEGDRTDAVATFGYYLNDEQIVGYGILPQNPNYIPVEGENTDITDEAFDDFIFMTTDEEEEPEETPTAEEAPAPAVPMPAQSWERTAGGIKVSVEAPEGAFPENTKIAVTPVNGSSLMDTVSDAVDGEVLEVQAVDITFFDADGREIEPAVPIRVVMTPAATEHAEEKTSVVHVDVAQQTAELVEQAAGTEFDNSEVVFDADAFTIYAIVYTYQVDFEYEVDGKIYTASMPGAQDIALQTVLEALGVHENSKKVYATTSEDGIRSFMDSVSTVASTDESVVSVGTDWTIRVLKGGDAGIVVTMQDGAVFTVKVSAEGETEVKADNIAISTVGDLYLPAEAEAKAEIVEGNDSIAAVQQETGVETEYTVFDISLENVDSDQYEEGFNVTVALDSNITGKDFRLYHVHDGQMEDITWSLVVDGDANEDGTKTVTGFSFRTGEFSEFVLSYTVDFQFGEYEYHMMGWTSLPLSDLLSALGVVDGDAAAFMEKVSDVAFSDSSLLCVTHIDYPTTVAIVEDGIFDVVFPGAEIEVRSNRELNAGEWLLTSLAPFSSEEALTVTMKNGQQFVIDVFDAQEVAGNGFITDAQLTIDGTTYGKDETWHVYPDVGYTMKLSFAEKGSNQFPKGGDTIVVDLPAGLTIAEDGHHTFDIPAGLAGTITGNEYWVQNGKLYVKFGEDPEDILTRSSNAHFNINFIAKFDEGTSQISFNDKVKPNIEMDNETDVSVSKSASYNSATGKMDYTITVRSTGNSENVQVHDALTNTNLLTIDTSSITVSPSGTSYTLTNSSTSGFDMTIPSIGHNETVTIKYSADVNESALNHNGTVKVSDDGKNTVTVDDHTAETHTNQIKYSNTSKSSTSVEDHETEKTATLGWKIVLNDNYRGSIVGDTVTDTIDWSSKDAMKYSNPLVLTINAKNQDGSKTYTKTVTINQDDIANNQGQQSWSYIIPQFEDPNEILSYEITYTTEVDKTKLTDPNGIVKNNTDNEGDGGSTGTGVVPVTPPEEDKIVGGKSATDVTEEYVDWDIVINVPPEGFTDGLTVTDYIPMAPQYGGLADKFDSILSVTGLVGDETYTVDCISTDLNEDGSVNWNLRNNNSKRDIVTIVFYQDADKTQQGLTATTQARTVTIKIRTINDPKWLDYIDEHGSGDASSYYHTNIARANNTTFEGKAAPQRSKIKKSLIARNETAEDGMPVYQYAVDLAGVKSLPVVIEDTFNPDELEYYAYWYDTDNHQYIDGQPQQHMLNNGIAPYKASIVAENGKITITATDLPKKENGDFWEYYRIYYKLKIKSQAVLDSFTQKAIDNGGTYIVRNNAVWNGTDDHVDIEFTVPTIEKTGSFRIEQGQSGNNRLYDFSIDINKECLKLNAGEPMDLTDTHTDNLTVDYTTVKVYRYDGETKTLDTSIQWNFNGNIGTFYNLQDETHYTIEYSCLVIGSAIQAFSNYAEMNGYHAEKHDSRDFGSTIDAGADVFQIGLIKYKNGMTSLGLGGATFQLFRGTGSFHEVTNGTYTWMEEDRIPMTWGVGTETAGKVGQNITFTTNSSGYVLIALDQTRHGAELEEGVHYFLKEIESPPGYQIDSSVEYWEFTLTMDPDEVCYGTRRDQYGNRLWIYFYYDDILKMNNTQTNEPITVKVDKEWFDIEENKIANPDQTAIVQLYQKKNDEDYQAVGTITVGDTTYNGRITLPFNDKWDYVWENLPRVDTDGNAYAYKLEEVEVPEDFVSTSSLTETDNEKSYHLENYQVTERKVNVSVSKQWFDENGTTPISVDDLPADLTEIQFYLYRVVSRAPFTTAPTSGGNPYNIDGNPYLVTGSDAEPGLYKISRSQFSAGISFDELPSVHKDDDGTWYFYSYYVKEVPVEGYAASVSVEETTNEQNNTILLTSMKNKKKPEERTTDLNVVKEWKDKEGKPKSWPADTVVRFKLYQVTSTKPFEETPSSGGTLYDVKTDEWNYHSNRVGEGTYKIENDSPITFSGLPEVTIDVNEKATYYAYYVDEVEVTGYETTYSYDTSVAGTVSIVMTNQQEPDYTQLTVEKKWFDGEDEITDQSVLNNLSATVELVRYRAVPNGTMVHFYRFSNGHFVKIDNSDLLVKSSTQDIGIHFSGLTGGSNAYYGSDASALTETETYKVNQTHGYVPAGYVQPTHGENITITTGAEQDLYVVFYNDVSFASAVTDKPATDSGVASIDTTFDSSAYQITLDQSNSFAHTYAKLLTSETVGGQTYVYTYGVREVSNPTGFEFDSYSVGTNDDDTTEGIHASVPGTGTIIVKNKKTEEQTGALKLTKLVTVNGATTTTTLADGTYTFTIAGPEGASADDTISKSVAITVTNGAAASATVDSEMVNLEDSYVIVPGLVAGTYTITEVEPTNGTSISLINGADSDVYSTTVTVTAGDTTAAAEGASAAFTNNIDLGSLEITKNIQKNGTIDATATGVFYYAVYGEAYDSSAEPVQTPVATGSIEVTQNGTKTATVSNLPYGTYYVYELTGENGTPIVSGTDGTQAVIDNTTYTVTGSGTTATITSSTDPATATLTNNVETTSMEATKVWKSNRTEISWPDDIASVEFTLLAKIGDGEGDAVAISDESVKSYFTGITATVEIVKGTTPAKASWSNLPTKVLIPGREADPENGVEAEAAEWKNVTYSVVETKVKYTDPSKAELNTQEAISAAFNPQWDATGKTITNNKTDFEFTKIWKDSAQPQQNADWQKGTEIVVTVQRKIGTAGMAETVGKYTIKKTGDGNTASDFQISKDQSTSNAPDLTRKSGESDTFQITGLQTLGTIGETTGEYTYFVTEDTVTGYQTSYVNPSVSGGNPTPSTDYAVNGGSIINTPVGGYVLPQTGGIGTSLFTTLGAILASTAGAALTLKKRKEK